MSKHNFDFNDLKKSLESNATKENEYLKKDIEYLKNSTDEVIKELQEKNEELTGFVKFLCNRCYVLMGNPTASIMCYRCGITCCEHYPSFDDQIKYASKMRKEMDK